MLIFQLIFVVALAVGVSAPERRYYPSVPGMTQVDRDACNAKADAAREKSAPKSTADPMWAVIPEVDAFVACAKERGYKI
jgi:hypothetical protein